MQPFHVKYLKYLKYIFFGIDKDLEKFKRSATRFLPAVIGSSKRTICYDYTSLALNKQMD